MTLWKGEDNKDYLIFCVPKADALREIEKLRQNTCQ